MFRTNRWESWDDHHHQHGLGAIFYEDRYHHEEPNGLEMTALMILSMTSEDMRLEEERKRQEKDHQFWEDKIRARAFAAYKQDYPQSNAHNLAEVGRKNRELANEYRNIGYIRTVEQDKKAQTLGVRSDAITLFCCKYPRTQLRTFDQLEQYDLRAADRFLDIAYDAAVLRHLENSRREAEAREQALLKHEKYMKWQAVKLQERIQACEDLKEERMEYENWKEATGEKSVYREEQLRRMEVDLRTRNMEFKEQECRHLDWREQALLERKGCIQKLWYRVKHPEWKYCHDSEVLYSL